MRLAILLLAAALPLPLAAQDAAMPDGLAGLGVVTATYECERGVRVPVTYVNADAGGSIAVLQVEGSQVALEQAVSASGARYAPAGEGAGYRWWSKGDEGLLLFFPSGEAAEEETLLSECRALTEG